ncbi:MAG: type III pantothenate kinase [Bacteroidota bacterium]
MLLALDVGNTHTVLGVFSGEKLVADWRMSSLAHRTADENWLMIRSFCDNAGISLKEIKRVGISSVVPELTEVFESISREHIRVEPVTVKASLDLGIRNLYSDPDSVGADRLCNAIAGFAKYGGPLIVIDFGTATTYDVISATGDYLGGIITIGLEAAAAELHRRAAKLPRITLRFPETVIGRDTSSSMQAGLMFGTVETIEGIVVRIRRELESTARVIATGGLAPVVAEHTDFIEACEPTLVLDGVRLICERTHPTD